MTGILGCAQSYTVLVTHRGGGSPVGVLDGVTGLQWDRKYNNVGEASITMGQGQVSSNCCALMNLLAQDQSQGAYEIQIYRDTAEVWCGPILTLSETIGPSANQFVITAKDVVGGYLDRHWLQAGYNMTGDVVEIAATVLGADLATDDPGIGRGVVKTDAGVIVSRAAARASASVLSELNALVGLGLRYTTAVRTLYLGGLAGTPFGAPIRLTVSDIAGSVTVVHDATAYANTVYGTSGNAAAQIPTGQVPPDDPHLVVIGGPEPGWRGRIETGVSAAAGTNGQSSVTATAQATYFAARRPRVLRIADNSQLSATATVTVPDLICGSIVKIAGQGHFCTFVPEDLQLTRVQGTWGNNGEQIGISLGPVG